MYIAFKWLLGLSLAMWFVMCCIDMYFTPMKKTNKSALTKQYEITYKNVNITKYDPPKNTVDITSKLSKNQQWFGFFHYALFCAAGMLISFINKKKTVALCAKVMILKKYSVSKYVHNASNLKRTAIIVSDTISKYYLFLRENFKRIIMKNYKYLTQKYNAKRKQNHDNLRIVLINKLKEVTEERKKLSLLLAAAVCENRTIRTYYQLEVMAKTRLALHMEQTKKKIKESQLQYVNYQHLYLITQQENIYLKALIKKLTKQKEDAERNLISLVHEVCLSKNKKLMAFCSRFVVQTKDKLLCSDMSAEIKQFLTSTNSVHCSKSFFQQEVAVNTKDSTINQISEVEKQLMPLLSSSGPKLVGLPGEHIWTVKDKDGFIEKLYEYDFEPDFDNGDTIRRIREYSVYHDKDCFLENFHSRTVIYDDICETKIKEKYLKDLGSSKMMQNRKFLTGSEAFQMFLHNTQHRIVPVLTSTTATYNE